MKKLSLTTLILCFCAHLFAAATFYGTVQSPSVTTTNGSTNLSLTANAVMASGAGQQEVSIPNGIGFLNNNGSGTFNYTNVNGVSGSTVIGLWTDYLQAQTNWMTTVWWTRSDIADGTAGNTAGNILEGFGDTLGFSFGSSATGVLVHRVATPTPTGVFVEMRTAASSGSIAQLGSQTLQAVVPLPGSIIVYQTDLIVRNTPNTRIVTGFMASNEGAADQTTNGIYFRYSTAAGDTTWKGIVCDATNTTIVDTGVAVTTDTEYYLYWAKTNGTVTFTANRSTPAVASTHVPNFFNRLTDAMSVFYGVDALASAATTNLFRFIGYQVAYNTNLALPFTISTNGSTFTPPFIGYNLTDETNYDLTFRYMPADVANLTGTFGYEGFGDTFSFGGTGSIQSRQNVTVVPASPGPWSEWWATALNTAAYSSSATQNAIQPFHNMGFYFQAYDHPRNTNKCRYVLGFSSALTSMGSDQITNSAYFRYDSSSNDTTWHAVVCNATNEQILDTGVPVIPDADYFFQMWKTNGTTNVTFSVNHSTPVSSTAFAPDRVVQASDYMYALIGVTPLESANKTNWFRYVGYWNSWQTNTPNLNFASSSSLIGGSFLTDLMQAETNSMWTMRTIDSDVADGTASTFNGFGDSITFASSISGAVATRHNTNAPITGTWAEMSVGASVGAAEFMGSQSFEAMPPYNGGTFTCQALLQVRNTNNVRLNMGFTAGGLIAQLGSDTIITNGIYFRYSTAAGDGTWKGVVSDGTNMTIVDTAVPLANDGLYFLSFTKSTNGSVTFTVNRGNAATVNSAVPNNYLGPNYGMAFFLGYESLDGVGAKTNLVHYVGYKSDWLDDGARGSEGSGGGGSGSGSSVAGPDINMTNLTAYVNNTNFFVDFGFPSATLVSTGAIAFQYTTNWPGSLTATSRVCNVSIPATNFLRYVWFQNGATNWRLSSPVYTVPPMRGLKLSFQIFGQGETNVTVTPTYDIANAPGLSQVYNLANVTSATNIMLFDASRGTCYNDPFFLQLCTDGQEIKGWADSSGKGNYVTNFAVGITGETFHNCSSALYNVPQVQVGPVGASPPYLRSPTISTLTWPITVFEIFRVSSINMAMFDGTDSTHRLMCYAGAGGAGACSIASENTSSFATGALPYSQNFVLYTYHFDTAASASLIRTNAVTALSGTLTQTTCTAVSVCGAEDVTAPQSIGYLVELQVWWGALTTTDYGNIETNYFRAKYHNW